MQEDSKLNRRALLVFIEVRSILLSEMFLEALLVLFCRAGSVSWGARHGKTSSTSSEKTRRVCPARSRLLI